MKTEPNTMKRRVFLLQKMLYKSTDEQHTVSSFEILEFLEDHGIRTNLKTIRGDIECMVECGMDIITIQSKPNKYFWGNRVFEQAELKLLIDAVCSSRFITQKKSKVLVKKLASLSNVHGQKNLKRHLYATNRAKACNESLLYIVDAVNEAIDRKKKVTFQYIDYSPEKKKFLRNDGEIYTLSPYALFWNEDYYYVVGYSEKHENVSSFRADRIYHINISDDRAVKKPEDYSIDKYSTQIFEMFDEETMRVKLQCNNELMRYVIDRFGEAVETEIADEKTFFAYADVALSPNFYSWVFKFSGKIRILEPLKAEKEFVSMAHQIINAE